MLLLKVEPWGTSPMVQWLRLCLSMQRAWVQSLVRELRSHMPRGTAKGLEKKKKVKSWDSVVRCSPRNLSLSFSFCHPSQGCVTGGPIDAKLWASCPPFQITFFTSHSSWKGVWNTVLGHWPISDIILLINKIAPKTNLACSRRYLLKRVD